MQSNQDVPIVVTVNHGDSGDTNMEDAPNFEPYLAGHHKVNDQGCLDITNQSYKWPTDSGSLTSPLETSSGAAGGNKYRKLPAIPIKTAEDNQDSSLLAAKQQPSFLTSTEDYLQRQLDEQERKYRQSESAAKDLTIKLGSTLSKLEDAQNQRNELETQLSLTHFELDKEHNQRLNLETKLKESDHQLEDIRKRWKQSAKELGQLLKANNQALYQVTDSYLIGLTEQLQYNLRTFAIQHFSSPPRTAFGNSRAEFSPYLEKVSSDYKLYVNSPQHCHRVVQGFLWRVLCDRLFCQYYWMPSSHGKAPAGLAELLRPKIISPSTQHPVLGSRESRYNVWQATTTSLLLEKRDSLCKGDEVVGKTKAALSGLLEDINEVLLHIRPSHGSGYKKQLLQILVDAADLDLEISRQVASISWHFSLDGQDDARQMYDPRFMELDVGENAPSGGREHEVKIVLAPAMVKRGKSTGEAKSFEERPQWLTKMKASLVSL